MSNGYDCVKLVKKLLAMVKANEWQYRHAAENRYCPYCANDNDMWKDQKEHHNGCILISLIAETEKWLESHREKITF